ncbi:MAG: Arc family DNA-binding protein [Candidatus Eisenbacteria bacterium]|uniref:Arc family DNA-binding protein n=1 Tax=Eiseniibacteriota bacterium TaxID=2212470 RepID=A0A948W6A5_UNCEI|nr:Arc family DNA-binding protein [Candidatus Eisenbacteria bacterium]MBU1950981.1 Arc family DNA-binding protein [Candidatus Eisenbacteria bacterium]MBU2690910.1 Arc family DNA-binding protein [Candidatus Eisenbacteria bacterium]
MPNITIKGLPETLYQRLKNRALRHRRSLNSEVIVCLEQAVNVSPLDPEAWLSSADRSRKRFNLTPLTESDLRKAKEKGRP